MPLMVLNPSLQVGLIGNIKDLATLLQQAALLKVCLILMAHFKRPKKQRLVVPMHMHIVVPQQCPVMGQEHLLTPRVSFTIVQL